MFHIRSRLQYHLAAGDATIRVERVQIISRIIDHGSQLHLLGDIDATSFIQPRQ